MVGSFDGCCARAASGHAAAAPPSSAMNRRRCRSNIGKPLPRRWSVYRTVSLLRRARQVLGVGLNCSEIGGLMYALGQNRTSDGRLGPRPPYPRNRTSAGRPRDVRFVPYADVTLPVPDPSLARADNPLRRAAWVACPLNRWNRQRDRHRHRPTSFGPLAFPPYPRRAASAVE